MKEHGHEVIVTPLSYQQVAILIMALQQITFSIPGMHCEGCTQRVARVLERMAGVRSAEVSLEEKQAVVRYDDDVDPDALRAAIEKAGYTPAEPIK